MNSMGFFGYGRLISMNYFVIQNVFLTCEKIEFNRPRIKVKKEREKGKSIVLIMQIYIRYICVLCEPAQAN